MTESKVIIQLSDLHVPGAGNLYGDVDSLQNVVKILQVLEKNGLPNLLLLTGDIADKGEVEAYRRLRAVIDDFTARLGVPAMYLPGNHDKRPAFRSGLLDLDASDDKSDQVLWSGGLRVIGLDSTAVDGHYGELESAQLQWLAAELEQPAPLGTVIAMHHPPIPGPIEVMNLLALREPEKLAATIKDRDVKMLLAGHNHHASAGVLGDVPVWVSTATAYQLDVPASDAGSLRGIPGSGYTRIDVTKEGTFATHVAMLSRDRRLFDVDLDLMRRGITGEATAEELEAAFSHALASE